MLSDSARPASPSLTPHAAIRAAIPAGLPTLTRARIERRACAALGLRSRFDLICGAGLVIGTCCIAFGLLLLAAASLSVTFLGWCLWYIEWR